MSLFHSAFYGIKFVGRRDGIPVVLPWQEDFVFDRCEDVIGWYFINGDNGVIG